MVEVRKHKDPTGKVPIDRWLKSLKDTQAKKQVMVRIRRLSLGLEGDRKSVGENVMELRIHTGKGYRIYYTWIEGSIVLLLIGGSKVTQEKDIKTAKRYRRDYYARQL